MSEGRKFTHMGILTLPCGDQRGAVQGSILRCGALVAGGNAVPGDVASDVSAAGNDREV